MLVIAAIAVLAAIAVAAIRMPLVRRFGLRNAMRRPREAALVMLGCILGTALIIGNASVGDSFTASVRDQALQHIGPLDAIVEYGNVGDWAGANAELARVPRKGVALTTAVASVRAPITNPASRGTAPQTIVTEANYQRAGALGATSDGARGTGPTAGNAWASENLAQHLSLHVGSVVVLHAKTLQRFVITQVVNNPLASFLNGNTKREDSLLVPPGTVTKLQSADPLAIVPAWRTLIVGTGTHGVTPPSDKSVAALRATIARVVTPFNGELDMTRSLSFKAAAQLGKGAAVFLTTIGAFGILAGILLLVNVLLMLAEERLAELGTMRAVGLSRAPLIGAFTLEGALYSVVGALIGGIVGVGLGRFLVALSAKSANATKGDFPGLPLHFSVNASTVMTGIAAGFLVAAISVIGTSYRVSRLDVIRSLRALPDPARKTQRRAATPLLVVGIVIGAACAIGGYAGKAELPLMLGGPILLTCVGLLVSHRFGFEAGVAVGSLPTIAWCISFHIFNPATSADPNSAVVGGVITVAAGVLFLNSQQVRIARRVRRHGRGRATLPARLGLANPVAHRVRTLLTVGPFAIVVFTLTYAEGLSHMIDSELHKTAPLLAGNYQVYAQSSQARPFDFDTFASSSVRVAKTGTVVPSFEFDPNKKPRLWPMTAIGRDFANVKPPPLISRSKKFKTDAAAYRAVASDPDLLIASGDFLLGGGFAVGPDDPDRARRVGDVVTMINPATDQARDVTIIGVAHGDVLGVGAFYGAVPAKALFGAQLQRTNAFISTTEAPAALAQRMQRAGTDSGVEARVISTTADAFYSEATSIVNLFRSDLGIGIVVGVAGIGVVLVRSVRDRRRQIGTLRAMGLTSGDVGKSFLLEGAFIAVQSLVVGVGLGFVTVMALSRSSLMVAIIGYKPPVPMPPPSIILLMAGLFAASLLASALPARAASKIPPAVALRLVD